MDDQQLRERVTALVRYGNVGMCVNSVTHDVNNYLGAILAYSELVEQDEGLTAETKRMLGNIQESVKRSTEALSALTMIARKERDETAIIELPLFVDRLLNLRRYDFRMNRVALDFTTPESMPSLVVDRPKLAMALLYILKNAYEAVVGNQGARVVVALGMNGSGDAAEIVISDSGPGVPEADQEKIFEPFFTTKGGEHLGLGLAFARDLASALGGSLTYDAARGFVVGLRINVS